MQLMDQFRWIVLCLHFNQLSNQLGILQVRRFQQTSEGGEALLFLFGRHNKLKQDFSLWFIGKDSLDFREYLDGVGMEPFCDTFLV
ncbi:hypothetical protein BFO01nite_31890 [Brevibacillus formosus]|uniref:Uncharacterized protein n=1 Tax=Brevibacillus formosus TaxID=54913 RepID=A0ABQ0T6Y5_9BACL|nr:hypothetical protein BFO01nite_31890 [Brevibacillus formosus]